MTEPAGSSPFLELIAAKTEPVAVFLGMEVLELRPGHARVGMLVRPEFLNFYGVAFGGIIMSLADQAFGYAINSVNYPGLALQFDINFLASARAGDRLTAEGRVIKNGKRISVAEVNVFNQAGKLIARATGTTIAVPPAGGAPAGGE
jgi:acyl-CoA thioesterase